MTTRLEARLGAVKNLGSTYTSVGQVASAHTFVLHLHVTNLLTSTVKLRAFVVSSGWSTGEPTTDKVAALAFDEPLVGGQVHQITGIVMQATEKLVVWSDTTAGLDILASGNDVS